LDLAEYYILDPLWVTTGVYRIITSEKAAKQSGIILYENLKDIVNSVKIKDDEINVAESNKYSNITYTPNESRYLADIMSMFKLCFFAENKKIVFIPDLFAKETPANEVDEILKNENKLEFIYDYPFLHHSVISRLIVEVNGEIQNFWRTGVIIKSKTLKATALIRVLTDKVLITITGNKKDKRQYLSQIRFFIEKINEEFNLKPKMKIPLPGLPNRFVKYEHLIAMEKEGVKTYKDWDAIIDFEICKLLEGIDSTEEIQKEGPNTINNYFNINLAGMNPEVIKNITKNTEGFDIDRNQKNKVFISYSNDERDLRDNFEKRLNKAFVNSKNSFDTIWSDEEIATSKDWKQEIQKALQQSNIGVLLVSTSFLSSKYCMYEFQQMLERVKSDGYTIVPVLFRFCHFENSPDLAGMQFVGTYKSEYKGTNPDDGKDLMPFEDLADIDKPKDRLLDRYFIKIVEAIDKAIGG
jgi:hypothetical protein